MKKLDLGQSIQIAANLGVIAGIIFLAVEISQNEASLEEQNTLTRLSARDTALDYFSDWRTLLLENPELFDVWERGNTGDSLTSSEASRYEVLCLEHLFMGVTLYNRFDALGLAAEKEGLLSYMAAQVSASEASLSCWDTMKSSVAERGYADFADFVDQRILESR